MKSNSDLNVKAYTKIKKKAGDIILKDETQREYTNEYVDLIKGNIPDKAKEVVLGFDPVEDVELIDKLMYIGEKALNTSKDTSSDEKLAVMRMLMSILIIKYIVPLDDEYQKGSEVMCTYLTAVFSQSLVAVLGELATMYYEYDQIMNRSEVGRLIRKLIEA